MDLAEGVRRYLESAGEFGRALHLSALGLGREETEQAVAAWDEDYQISRFLLLSREPNDQLQAFPPDQRVYLINGFECTHLNFQPGIRELL